MAIFKIPLRVKKIIENRISQLFDSVKSRFLSPRFKREGNPHFDRSLSLPGMYEDANKVEGGIPSIETVESLIDSSDKYFNSLKDKTVNKVISNLEGTLSEGDVTPEDLNESIAGSLEEVKAEVQRIVESQTQASKNIGLFDGILRRAGAVGIADPLVAFVPVKNRADICDECFRLHLLEDGITPRVYKFSELTAGYHEKGSDVPSIHSAHPNCRCAPITLFYGYGFKGGKIAYISKDHNEYNFQRGIEA